MTNLLNILSPFKNHQRIVVRTQSVGDIISGIMFTHNKYKSEYDKIAKQFEGKTNLQTAKNIFDFLKAHTHYVIESDSKQTLRSPSAILVLGNKKNIGLDCKSYALFIGGILDALRRKGKNINWCYRFASYSLFNKLPHHVFVVINPDTKHEIWVDPVLPTFNNKKAYSFKIDKYMSLITVSGIEDGVGRRKPKKSKAERKQVIKNKLKKRGKLLLKWNPATITARNAFLLIVKLNLFRIATRLNQMLQIDSSKLEKFWKGIGGNWNSLQKNISQGKNKRQKNKVGVVVAAGTAAAVVSATPIVLKIVKLLKSVGIETKDLEKIGKKIVEKVVKKKIDNAAEDGREDITDSGSEDSGSEDSGGEDSGSEDSGSEDSGSEDSGSEDSGSEDSGSEDSGDTVEGTMDKILPIAGLLLLGYVISKN